MIHAGCAPATPSLPSVELAWMETGSSRTRSRRDLPPLWRLDPLRLQFLRRARKSEPSAVRFEIALCTNLSCYHLDFHGDMDSYFRTKRQLFEGLNGVRPRIMVLNSDDPRYEDLRSIDPSRVLTYGMQAAADVCPVRHQFGWENTEAFYKTPLGELEVRTSLMGKPNLLNIGAAISVGIALGLRLEAIASGIERLGSVSGRFEPVREGQPFRLIVDYAHTYA